VKTETFSYLPPLTNEQIEKQIQFLLNNGWVVGIEYSNKPSPSLAFWDWWKLPLFNLRTTAEIMAEIEACIAEHPNSYVCITSYDTARQRQTMSFVVRRPA